ncbi:MAG: tRNA-dihydrouridine synthase [Candidatus Campbellbacteria bacterium]|nr:tRNA-dihydrouridine synthase [Candidatus Campbellbacteria bacterium]
MALAPMANVTDAAFRRTIAKYGKPDVFWTEFVSADGLDSPGRERLLVDLKYSEEERPVVAQIFSADPLKIEKASALVNELGFDGVDINMGCPDKAVNKQGAGAALSKDLELAKEIVRAAKRGAGDLPVSVKIRLGYDQNQIEEWIPALLEVRPAVIIVHGRTRKEMSKVPARWDEIARCVEARDEWSEANNIESEERTLIFGNGDVEDLADAKEKAQKHNVDGVMLGRAIFGNPWLFDPKVDRDDVPRHERLQVMLEHAELFNKLLGEEKPFHIMRKHFGAYVSGFPNASGLRERLMNTESIDDAREVISEEIKSFSEHGVSTRQTDKIFV